MFPRSSILIASPVQAVISKTTTVAAIFVAVHSTVRFTAGSVKPGTSK